MKDISPSIFTNSVIYFFIGLTVLLGINFFDYRRLKVYGFNLYAGTIFIWLMLLGLGKTFINGKPYLNLGFININYIDVTPVLLTIAVAGIFLNKDWAKPNWFVSTVFLLIVPNILYIGSSSVASAIIYTVVYLILMVLSGARKNSMLA
ncbi:conserved hypothetical protein [Desulforamulus reducens MI-1]|uniref:Uncharacterized protein n=1 Tax=Desulforamulus reducens (strain ATCC BAA-1160 / DSM 100696 / MI-1) TaxID=349161 RepID=A4J1A7_DESRM|nr:conserved hypothetical protein [Desulforamulus reducens MI-1]